MSTKKLESLGYNQKFNIDDENDFRSLIFWLENMKIRFYPPDNRGDLLPESSKWNEAFTKYLNEIGFSNSHDNKTLILDWLLNIALRYEMEDTRNQHKMSREDIAGLINVNSTSDLSGIDINSQEFISELRELSKLLNVPFNEEEPLITLRAIAILLKRLKMSTLKENQSNVHSIDNKKKKLTTQVDESILNRQFSKNTKYDPLLNRAANVLRLLYINDLRGLQTQVNGMLVQVQSLTANPKTDTSLGKVGR